MSKLGQFFSKLVLRRRATNYDQYMTLYKTPSNPKIVILGPYNDLFNQLINKNFSDFRTLTVEGLQKQGISSENDIVDTVAQNMVSIDETFNDGYFIQNFPKNVAQAERLDRLLDGVNLVLHIQLSKDVKTKLSGNYLECLTCGQLFNSELDSTLPQQPGTDDKCNTPQKCNIVESATDLAAKEDGYNNEYKEVLDFYEKRGLLLNFIIEEHWSFAESIDRLKNEILANIKL